MVRNVGRRKRRSEEPFWLRLLVASFFTALCLAHIWQVGLVGDDYFYWQRAMQGAHAGPLPGGVSRPVSSWALVGLFRLAELSSFLLPATRIVHHALNSALVGWIAQRHLRLGRGTSWVATLAFAVWGSHGEVYWQSSLHDVMATTGVLLALILAQQHRSGDSLVSLAAVTALAFLCKEAAWPLVALLAFFPMGAPRPWRARQATVFTSIAVLAAHLVLRALTVSLRGDLEPGIYAAPSLALFVRSMIKILVRTLVPGIVDMQTPGRLLSFFVATLCAVGIGARSLRTSKAMLVRVLALLLSLVASAAPACMLSVSLRTSENHRYLYLATCSMCWLFATLVQHARRRHPCRASAIAVVVLVMQGGSLFCIGERWQAASEQMHTYRQALTNYLRAHADDPRRLFIACVPDSVFGAYAARNATEPLVAALNYAPGAHVVASFDAAADNSRRCKARFFAERYLIQSTSAEPGLTHPSFATPGGLKIPPLRVEIAPVNRQWRAAWMALWPQASFAKEGVLLTYEEKVVRQVL